MKLPPLKKGDIVEVEFLDHCEDDSVLRFLVWGKVEGWTKHELRILSWTYADEDERSEKGDPNEKLWSIVKKAITKLRRLR